MDSGERPSADADDDTDAGRSDSSTDQNEDTTQDFDQDPSDDPTGAAAGSDAGRPNDGAAREPGGNRSGGPRSVRGSNPEPAASRNGSDAGSGSASDSAATGERTHPAATGDDRGALGRFAHRFRTDQTGPLMWLREMLSSALIVLAIGLLLFAISGVWPPMVAVESGSMEPNMEKGDLIFVTEPDRFAPDAADNDVGVVTHENGRSADYSSFGSFGSVIVFHEPGSLGPPVIHRAHFYVEEDENWYDRADESFVRGDSCEEIRNCPAPHDGFITKGDSNPTYDQVSGIAPPVQQSWVTGVARLRIPYLGWIRLVFTGAASLLPVSPGSTLLAAGASATAVSVRSRRSGR